MKRNRESNWHHGEEYLIDFGLVYAASLPRKRHTNGMHATGTNRQ